MAITENTISAAGKKLDTTEVVQTDTTVAQREAVVITDPETLAARAAVVQMGTGYGSESASIDGNLPISLGSVPGLALFEKFGRNPDVDTTSDPEDVWNGGSLYTGFPSETETLEVFSSDANDTAAGTGLRTLRLYGQLAGVAQTEDVTLNGATPVATTKTWSRMNRVRGMTAGSGGVNAGTITVRHTTTTANVFAVVPAGTNRSQIAAFTVPAAKTLYLDALDVRIILANGGAGSATIGVMCRESGTGFDLFEQLYTLDVNTAGATPLQFKKAFVLPPLTDVVARLISVTDNNTSCTAQFFGVMVDD